MREKINSTNALVAYLDILGYSQLIKSGEYANIAYGAINSSIFRWIAYAERKIKMTLRFSENIDGSQISTTKL